MRNSVAIRAFRASSPRLGESARPGKLWTRAGISGRADEGLGLRAIAMAELEARQDARSSGVRALSLAALERAPRGGVVRKFRSPGSTRRPTSEYPESIELWNGGKLIRGSPSPTRSIACPRKRWPTRRTLGNVGGDEPMRRFRPSSRESECARSVSAVSAAVSSCAVDLRTWRPMISPIARFISG